MLAQFGSRHRGERLTDQRRLGADGRDEVQGHVIGCLRLPPSVRDLAEDLRREGASGHGYTRTAVIAAACGVAWVTGTTPVTSSRRTM